MVSTKEDTGKKKGRMADQILTSKLMGFPVMILLLLVIFWLTIKGANYPSEVLSNFFGTIEGHLLEWCQRGKLPAAIYEPLLFGVYRVTAWVVSVMLPPMAIFFPMFTISRDRMGCFCHAASDGDFLSDVYDFGRSGISAESSI